MQCPIEKNEDILLDYCAGKLAPAACSAFERHMETCSDCRTVVTAQRAVWNNLDRLETRPVSPDFDRRLHARIEQYEASGWWRRVWAAAPMQSFWLRPGMPIVTLCVVALVAVMLYLPAPFLDSDPQAPAKIESSEIDQLETTLEDMEMLRQVAPPPASRS